MSDITLTHLYVWSGTDHKGNPRSYYHVCGISNDDALSSVPIAEHSYTKLTICPECLDKEPLALLGSTKL